MLIFKCLEGDRFCLQNMLGKAVEFITENRGFLCINIFAHKNGTVSAVLHLHRSPSATKPQTRRLHGGTSGSLLIFS